MFNYYKINTKLCTTIGISLIVGVILIAIARESDNFFLLPFLFIISISISGFMTCFLPHRYQYRPYTRFDKPCLKRMGDDPIIVLAIILTGPIALIFIILYTFKKR